MKTYTMKKVNGIPDWNTIAPLSIDTLLWTQESDIRAQAQLCWSDTAIHVRLMAKESHIRAEYTGLMASVCEDSCLEFFFCPTEDSRYFNFEFNSNCALFLGIGTGDADLVRLIVQDQNAVFAPNTQRTADGWEITYQIPFTFIRQFFPSFTPRENLQLRGNCYKCGDLTENPHFFAWNPIATGTTFHCPQYFGQLILGGTD